MAYNVVAALLSWQLILPHLTVVQASTHWVVTEDGRIQAQVVNCAIVTLLNQIMALELSSDENLPFKYLRSG